MITFDRVNRRTHLFLGLILVPWVLMYGISSLMISHMSWFRPQTPPSWEPMFERPYRHPVPDQVDLRTIGLKILKDNDLEGVFFVQRPNPGELRITRQTFFDQIRLIYSINEQKLHAERQHVPWHQAIVRMHFRGGYSQPLFLNKLWAFMVDLACAAILLWIASGLIMWWRLAHTRFWGAVALSGGLLSFLLFVWQL
jgi:hypothetical protein